MLWLWKGLIVTLFRGKLVSLEKIAFQQKFKLYYLVHVVIVDSVVSQQFSKTELVIDIYLLTKDLMFRVGETMSQYGRHVFEISRCLVKFKFHNIFESKRNIPLLHILCTSGTLGNLCTCAYLCISFFYLQNTIL